MPRPRLRHAFDGRPPPTGGTDYPLSRRDRALPVTRLPVSVSPNPGEGQIGSNEAFQPRAPVASQRAALPALRDGELVTVGTRDQQQTRGWQPLAEGLAHPVFGTHRQIGAEVTAVGRRALGIFYMRALRSVNHVIRDHGVTAGPTPW